MTRLLATHNGGAQTAIPRLEEQFQAAYADVRYQRCVVALRFDDGYANDYSVVYPALTSRKLVAGFALVSDTLNAGTDLTIAQAQTMNENGMEIMHHTKSHADPTVNGGESYAEAQTVGDLAAFKALGPFYADSLVQPGVWTGDWYFDDAAKLDGTTFDSKLRENYAGFEAYVADDAQGDGRGLPVQRRYGPVSATGDGMDITALQAVVDQAIQYGQYVEIKFHTNVWDTGSNLTTADFLSFLDYLQTKRDAGYVNVLTPTGAAFARKGDDINQIVDPSFQRSATGAFSPNWIVTGSPTVVAGRTTSAVRVSNANYVVQRFRPFNYRSLYFECYATCATAGSAKARVLLYGTGTGTPVSIDKQVDVSFGAWTKVSVTFAMTPAATNYMQVWLYHLNDANPDVLYSDCKLVKL